MSKTKIILAILIAAYTIYFSYVTIARHHALYSGRFDLGNMEQTVWNTAHGRIFQMTNPDASENASRLAYHADFFLILLAPIYMLFPFTETLLVVQALVVALGALPVYLIAKIIFPPGNHPTSLGQKRRATLLPIIFAIVYLLSPILERANIYEFHSEVPGVTFLLFTFYFLLIGKKRPFLIFFFLALIAKETVSLVLAMIRLFAIIKNKWRRFSIFLFVFCTLYFLFIVKVAIPRSNTAFVHHFALRHFGEGDQSLGTLILSYLKNPASFLKLLFNSNSLAYFAKILSTTGLFSLFSPLYLLFSLPPVLINTLANDAQFRAMDYQYQATIVPGLIISAMYGVKKLTALLKDFTLAGTIISLIIPVGVFVYCLREFSPLPGFGKSPYREFLTPYWATDKVLYWESRVPEDKSVSVTNNAGAHFAKRQLLYHFPNKIYGADYVIITKKSWSEYATPQQRDVIIEKLVKDKRYQLLDQDQDFCIFKRK